MKTLCFTVTSVTRAQIDGCDFAEVVGNIPELGSWDTAKGVRATGPRDGEYTASVDVPDDVDEIEFKWVFCYRDTLSWEIGLNKVVFDLPQTPGVVCHISNVVNGPAQTYHEAELTEPHQDNRVAEEVTETNHAEYLKMLNPQNWSRRNQLIGIGIGLLLPVFIAFKIMN